MIEYERKQNTDNVARAWNAYYRTYSLSVSVVGLKYFTRRSDLFLVVMDSEQRCVNQI